MLLRSFLVVAALLSGAVTLLATPADAAGGQASFAVKPVLFDPALPATKSYFIVQAKPGDVIADKVTVANTGTSTGTAYLYAVDATTGQTSGAVYLSRQSPRNDVGRWTRLARAQVTLAPGASTIVPFTIRVPADARPGDHLGGIVAENSEIQNGSGHGALRIRIKHLTIAAVELQLPGRVLSRVDVTGVKPGGQQGWQYIYVHLRNTGTVLVKPKGRLAIRKVNGRLVTARKLELDTFVPRTAIDYPVLLPRKTLAPGKYTATVTIASSDRGIAGYRTGTPQMRSTTHAFAFTVSSADQKQVFTGVAPATAPPSSGPRAKDDIWKQALFGLALIAAAVLLVLLAFHVLRKRRAARRRAETGADVETTSMLAATAPPVDHDAPTVVPPASVQPPPPPVVDEPDPELENLPGAALGFAILLTAAVFAAKLLEREA